MNAGFLTTFIPLAENTAYELTQCPAMNANKHRQYFQQGNSNKIHHVRRSRFERNKMCGESIAHSVHLNVRY